MSARALRVGTRGSALALWQAERIRGLLRGAGHATERIEIRTTGDVVQHLPLSHIGSRALFTKQLDDALLAGQIDLAVHSLKDLPTDLPDGIVLAAIDRRDDPRDALVGRGPLRWTEIPHGATLATSSIRRRAQVLHWRPDLQISDVRGNVDTRLEKLDARPEWTGILLAVAGLERLGRANRIGERLPLQLLLPAPGQGALAVTVRRDDRPTLDAARRVVHHAATATAVLAERAFLQRLEGGCQVPVAAHAEPDPQTPRALRLHGRIVSLRGERMAEGAASSPVATEAEAEALGVLLAERLLREGAAAILAEVRADSAPVVTEP